MDCKEVTLRDVIEHSSGRVIKWSGIYWGDAIREGGLSRESVELISNKINALTPNEFIVFSDGTAAIVETGYEWISDESGGDSWTKIWLYR